jgi:NAD-dependent deacetylase
MSEPELFFSYYKNHLIFPDAKPNAAHRALAKLEADGKLSAVVTQNIDGLHQAAGSKNVFELHGSVHRNYCMDCGKRFDLAYILEHGPTEGVPRCDVCGGVVRPDVVLYEESLNDDVVRGAVGAIAAADVLIVGGTSLVVYPAASYLGYFHGDKLVLINKTETGYDNRADLVIHAPIGEVLSSFLQG